jgi:hypothetical protein
MIFIARSGARGKCFTHFLKSAQPASLLRRRIPIFYRPLHSAVADLGARSMRTGPAITLRTCSTCASWSGDGKVDKGEYVIKASCLSHKEIKSGSDKCGRWEKRRRAEVKSIYFWGVVSHE